MRRLTEPSWVLRKSELHADEATGGWKPGWGMPACVQLAGHSEDSVERVT